ncbi:hypothetical protein [Nitratireductor sp. CH_MIT9313-5]|uniref:hypothetical protein n=1 Tax=Nitratireductor sp. CH_MIT9313-5 TaxID=3107764 RepID=UPI00300A1658
MKLAEYMTLTKKSDSSLSAEMKKETGVVRDRSTISRWRRMETRPDWDAMKALTAVTRGAVTASDFFEIKGRKKANAAA